MVGFGFKVFVLTILDVKKITNREILTLISIANCAQDPTRNNPTRIKSNKKLIQQETNPTKK